MALNAQLKLAILTEWPSQGIFADAIGMHQSRLSQIVRGHKRPSEDEIKAIAERLPNADIRVIFPEVAA